MGKINDIVLTIDIEPALKTYVDDAYLLSVMTKENKNYKNWITTYYTQLIYTYDEFDGHCLSFYGGKYIDCPFLDIVNVPREDFKSDDSFYKFIYTSLAEGYCIIPELNEFWVPDRRSYQNNYRRHTSMIYGMNQGENGYVFNIIGYRRNGDYAATEINAKELWNAFSSMKEEGWPIILLRTNEIEYQIDFGKIEYDLKAYSDNGLEESTYGKQDLFGLDVTKKLIDILYEIKSGKYRRDIRLLSIYAEQKFAVLEKLKFFVEWGVSFSTPMLLERYKRIYELAIVSFKVFLKYSITGEEGLVLQIINNIKFILEEENAMFPQMFWDFKYR